MKRGMKKLAAVVLAVAVALAFVPTVGALSGGKVGVETAEAAPTVNPVSNVKNDAVKGVGIKVTFTEPSSHFGYTYEIYRGPYTAQDESQFTKVGTTSKAEYLDTTVKHGVNYKYGVKSHDGNGHYSELVKATTTQVAYLDPSGAPTPGTAVANGNSVTLSWSGSD